MTIARNALTRNALGFRALVRRFSRDRDGVSAVEFALVLPIMLTLYLGGVELGDGEAIKFKTTLAARNVTDLASQYTTIDTPTMAGILGAASVVLTPYSTANISVTLSEIQTDPQGNGKIYGSCALNGNAHTIGSTITLPIKLQTPNIYILYGEVNYPYTPAMGYVMTGTINIYQAIYFYPRLSSSVTFPNSC